MQQLVDTKTVTPRTPEQHNLATDAVWTPQMDYGDFVQKL